MFKRDFTQRKLWILVLTGWIVSTLGHPHPIVTAAESLTFSQDKNVAANPLQLQRLCRNPSAGSNSEYVVASGTLHFDSQSEIFTLMQPKLRSASIITPTRGFTQAEFRSLVGLEIEIFLQKKDNPPIQGTNMVHTGVLTVNEFQFDIGELTIDIESECMIEFIEETFHSAESKLTIRRRTNESTSNVS